MGLTSVEMLSSKSNNSRSFLCNYYNYISLMEDRLAKLWSKDNQISSSPSQKLQIPFTLQKIKFYLKRFPQFLWHVPAVPTPFFPYLSLLLHFNKLKTIFHLLQINLKLSYKWRFLPQTKLSRKQKRNRNH